MRITVLAANVGITQTIWQGLSCCFVHAPVLLHLLAPSAPFLKGGWIAGGTAARICVSRGPYAVQIRCNDFIIKNITKIRCSITSLETDGTFGAAFCIPSPKGRGDFLFLKPS